ncbi:nicotinate phosphoribosyltransferase [Pseudactinotalea sp. HY158]|uniref:nicotinate phosphoribosyltransferase n=1 Tax=Pseudactinotalea sp. HY158 TaxID=2654547 RepID=UPI00129D1C38|nr:nicotinate phosphoribosyltransferase [Pseudactinotalea sp. HY158]QGH70197.1 nicotinate phosphoribosyltransferase [Pseudactinotalea sp. HY158]
MAHASTPGPGLTSTALLTDRYELTMLQAALADGSAHRRSIFEVFTRRLPPGRRYGVVAGTGRLLEAVRDFRFDEAELDYLRRESVVDTPTLDYLADYRFTGDIYGYAEGEVFFPGSPLLVVESEFGEGVLLETVVLSILNYDSAVASAASRMTSAAGSRPCLEMGSRRAHEQAAVAAARAATVAGFVGTSNLEAGRRYAIPTIGTAAHAFTLLYDTEEEAFAAQVAAYGTGTTLLVDTYDIPTGVRRAIAAAGTSLDAVRLDSGDLGAVAREVREQLDALGAAGTKIVVSSDLDEYSIAALAVAPVDSYGVGTSVVTGSGAPTCSMVYKLVLRENSAGEMEPVQKVSSSKASVGGRKNAARRIDPAGRASEEVIVSGAEGDWSPAGEDLRALHVPLARAGVVDEDHIGAAGLLRAGRRHQASRAELRPAARRLSAGDPALATVHVDVAEV